MRTVGCGVGGGGREEEEEEEEEEGGGGGGGGGGGAGAALDFDFFAEAAKISSFLLLSFVGAKKRVQKSFIPKEIDLRPLILISFSLFVVVVGVGVE